MTDDPRIESLAEMGVGQLRADDDHVVAAQIIGRLDAVDPLRALLADRDRAVELFSNALFEAADAPVDLAATEGGARAVLAALLGVAGP